MKKISISVEGVTTAVRARKLLRSEGISAKIVKSGEMFRENGCSHALEVDEASFFAAVAALRRASIFYRVSEK